MLDRILAKLRKQVGDLYIQSIVKTEKLYLISLSDKYGNDMDMSPLGFDIESGEEEYVDFDYNASGMGCLVPEEYATFRNIVCGRLYKNTPVSVVKEMGPYGINYAINTLFLGYISDISISQLYAVCNYMVYLIAFSCTEEEKSSFSQLTCNETVMGFVRMDNLERLRYVDDYYYMPDYVMKVDGLSNELLFLAKEKQAGRAVDAGDVERLVKNIRDALDEAYRKLKVEKDPVCDVKIIKNHLDVVRSCSEIESKYCRGLTDAVTERMKETDDFEGFGGDPPFTTDGVVFGSIKK